MRNSKRAGASGFTLTEIMIVVSIIGILLIIALPALRKARMRVQDTRFKNDLRLISDDAFQQYAMATGDFPVDAPAGVVPLGIEEYLPRHFEWADGPSIGGEWDWDRGTNRSDKVYGAYAGISILKPLRTSTQMREIDADIDDGDLSTGIFRSRPSGYFYVIEE